MLHAAGWLEGGLASGYEKFVMDADQLGIMQVLAGNMDLSENGQAMDAIREVGARRSAFPGMRPHQQANFETAFYRSTIADNNSYEQWEAEGAQDALKRANTLWKKMLANTRRRRSIPASTKRCWSTSRRRRRRFRTSNV